MNTSTRKRFTWVRLGAALFALSALFVLAGCGGDDDDAGTPTTNESSTTSTGSTSTESTATTETTSSTTTEPAGRSVEVHFTTGDGSDCSQVEAFERPIADTDDPLRTAFDGLVAGPTAEETAAGASSFFSSATADVIVSATVNDGLLLIDFTDLATLIPNASTSCGSESLLAQLTGTAFQFESVDRARFLLDGNCDAFANWLQRECFDTDRSGQQLDVPVNERAMGSGCIPGSDTDLPDGLWFGFVDDSDSDEISFDLACWFTGSAAVAAAAEDGEESPPPNDYHIRNSNDLLRTLTVSAGAEVNWLPDPGDPATAETVPYSVWLTAKADRDFAPGVWLTITGGEIVGVEEQYVP